MGRDVFTSDFREVPYWADAVAAQPATPAATDLPRSVDVVVVGAGLTGLSAAHELASAGRSVLVLDAGAPGQGASSRNAGMLGKSTRQSFMLLSKAAGRDKALSFFRELNTIFDESVTRIESEGFACHFRRTGRFIGALTPEHYERLAREYEARGKHLGESYELVPGSASGEMASGRYFGGVVLRDSAALHPALYTQAMLARAERAGARVVGHRPVTRILREADGFSVHTREGVIRSRDVLLATNGYTGKLTTWAAQRLLPINAYMVATEPLPESVLRELLPAHRTYVDNTRATRYMQLSPDRKRLLFGSRSGRRPPSSLKGIARQIHSDIRFLFPQLEGVKLSHAWTGRCAATWDMYPHVGVAEGVHYAIGYCFTGLALAPYLGRKAAQRILGRPEAATAFAERDFPLVPWYARAVSGWSTPIATRYYAWADRPARKG